MSFSEIAQRYTNQIEGFAPFAPITDRSAWNGLDEEWKKKTVSLGESYLHYEYPRIFATDFLDFTRTGNRVRFEDRFFARRHALDALVLAECTEDQGRFMDDIINGIFAICEESAWQLPPHNSYKRDEPQLPLPDATAPVLDLFACETGAVLATAGYLLRDRLDRISPFIMKRIRHEIKNRILTPYLTQHFWWMGNGMEPMNNWTIWCTQNVLLSAFLTEEAQEIKRAVFEKACKSADYFLAEYGTDGCCDEGAQYYRHAGLCLFNTIEILNAVSGNAFFSLYEEEKIRNIAGYILNVHVSDKYYVNFADCSPVAGRSGVREFLFALRTKNEHMAQFAAQDFAAAKDSGLLLPSENNLYYRLQNGFTAAQIRAYCKPDCQVPHPELFYPSTGLFIARDSSLYLAVKAGDNADSHNHNDTGSFTVYKDGQPLFIDVGVESYTKKTFSPQRYEIWTMQSAYHNLPTINGVMQKDGETYRASDVQYSFDGGHSEITLNLETAYPPETALLFYKRHAALQKGSGIVIRDSFAFSPESGLDGSAVVLSLMTYEKPSLTPLTRSGDAVCEKPDGDAGSGDVLLSVGDLGTLRAINAALLGIEEIPVTDARLQTAWEHAVYRILLQPCGNCLELQIS